MTKLIASLTILALATLPVAGSQNASVEELRSQLADVHKRDGDLQTRLRKLEEDLKPENIERFFALNGATRPEELREQRRRQLEIERSNVRAQLDQLGQSRVRLETAIAAQEAAAYRQSAVPESYSPTVTSTNGSGKKKQVPRRARRRRNVRARRG